MPLPEAPPLGRLPFEPPPEPAGELATFWELWRAEKFWACHEALEGAWLREPEAGRKQFLRGLIHGAVAVFQFRRGNFVGAARQLARARVRLRASLPAGQSWREGVDIRAFLEGIEGEVSPALGALSEGERGGLAALEAQLGLDLKPREQPGRAPAA